MSQAKSDKYSQGTLGFFINFFAGGFSGVIAKTATAPIERVKLILQTQLSNDRVIRPYKGIVDCFYRTVTEEGALALWRGNMANIIRYFPTQALNFAFKDVYRDMFVPKKKDPTNYTKIVFGNIMAGGFAGSTSTLFVYPLDLARTRLGVDMGAKASERQFTGVADCLTKIFKTDGLKGLYRGIGVSLFGIFCYRGLYFGSFDSGKGLLFNYDDATIFQKFFFAQACVIFSESISYPTDTVKRRLMMQAAKKEIKYTGGLDCIQKIYKQEGLKGFWKGNLTNIFRSVGSSLCLVLYDEMKKRTDKYALAAY